MPGTVTVGVLDLVPIFGLMTPIDTIPIVAKQSTDPRQVQAIDIYVSCQECCKFEKMPGIVTVGVFDLANIFGIMNPIDTIPIVAKQSMDPR